MRRSERIATCLAVLALLWFLWKAHEGYPHIARQIGALSQRGP